MKKIILLAFLSFIFLNATISYGQEKYVSFSAKIENSKTDSVYITDFYGEIPLKNFHLQNGESKKESFYLPMGYYKIHNSGESTTAFLKFGFDFEFSLDTKEFDETIKYKGKGAAENNYLAEKYLLNESFGRLRAYTYYAKFDEKDFLRMSDSLYQLQLNLFNKYKAGFDNDFTFIEEKDLEMNYLLKLSNYESMHGFVSNNRKFKVSEKYPNPFEDIDLKDTILLLSPNYINYVNNYLENLCYKKITDGDYSNFYLLFIDFIDSEIKTQKIKEEIAFYYIKYRFDDSYNLDKRYQKIKKIVSNNKEYLDLLDVNYQKIKRQEKGNIAPNFELYDIDNNIVKLSDFKGKLVYIDIWATWCSPCIKKIPNLQKLEKEFKDKEIVFISIAKNDNKERWEKTVRQNKLSGIQLFAPNENIEFFKFFMVDGVPRFILLNKNGKIINANAKRPSDEELIENLNKLLKD